jgi:hypothetical protein
MRKQDQDLDQISGVLTDLKTLADGMNAELTYQDKFITAIQDFTDETSRRTKDYPRRVKLIHYMLFSAFCLSRLQSPATLAMALALCLELYERKENRVKAKSQGCCSLTSLHVCAIPFNFPAPPRKSVFLITTLKVIVFRASH